MKAKANTTGSRNTGYWNTGNRNTGDYNTGNWNTGRYNTGSYNTGDYNTGRRNLGSRNTGNWNTGYRNTGDYNTGNWNTGDWNTGDFNTGFCNSISPEDCLIFNKPAKISDWRYCSKPKWMYVGITEWVFAEYMSDKEKEAYPSYVTTGGYLKCYSSLKAAYIDAWEKATPEDRALTEKLPNFDPVVFEEVFGFNPFKKHTIIINGKTIEVSEESYKKLKESLE